MVEAGGLLDREFGTLDQLVASHAALRPTHTALVHGSVTLDHHGFDVLVDRVAAALQRDCIGRGDVVAVCALSSIQYAAIFVGTLRSGAAVAPLAPSATVDSLAAMIADAGAKLLLLDQPAADVLAPAAAAVCARCIALDAEDGEAIFASWLAPEGARAEPVEVAPSDPFTSAPFAPELMADVLERWPGGLVEFYGMTKGGGSCMLEGHLHPDKLQTVGRPMQGSDIRLIDEDGHEVESGCAGEVVGRSASMMTSYDNLSEKTREAEWFSPDGQRFIRTGDIGRFDVDGFLMLVDRRKDMIISGGFNIYPSDIEAVLAQHPAVEESAFFGVPNERWGETPVAAVAPRFGAASTAEDILAFANGRLGKTQPPRGSVPSCVAAAQRDWQILKRDLRLTYPSTGGDSRHDDYRDR